MNYELALKLKNAGFILNGKHLFAIEKDNKIHCRTLTGGGEFEMPDSLVLCPTLSELIEACGFAFISLYYSSGFASMRNGQTLKWGATGFRKGATIISWEYSTPEESVANLWIELNKK